MRYALRSKDEFADEFVEFEPFVLRWVWAPKTTFVMLEAFVCDSLVFVVQLHKYTIPLVGSQCMPREGGGYMSYEEDACIRTRLVLVLMVIIKM